MAQTALITGATSGIGESLCLLFASDGYNLVTVARNEEALNQQAEQLRHLDIEVTPIACDLSQPDAARTIFKAVKEAGIEIEILVNDAGYSPAGQFSELGISDIRAMIQVSITSLAELTNVFLRPMLERGHGRILNMSSMMAKTPCPNNALYGAAKVFVLSFGCALSEELRGSGVTSTTVVPGATRTNFPINAGIEDAPAWKYFAMDADETAIRIYRALMKGRRCVVTGWYNKMGAMGTRCMPMAVQLKVGKWLIGTRKHPLDSEGVPPTGGYHNNERYGEGSGKEEHYGGGKHSNKRERYGAGDTYGHGEQHEHYGAGDTYGRGERYGEEAGHNKATKTENATDTSPEQEQRKNDPCGGGVGYRAATLGCAIYTAEQQAPASPSSADQTAQTSPKETQPTKAKDCSGKGWRSGSIGCAPGHKN